MSAFEMLKGVKETNDTSKTTTIIALVAQLVRALVL
jgi:hypothetical protein